MADPKLESELPVIVASLETTDFVRILTGPDNAEQVDKSVSITVENFRKLIRGSLVYLAKLTQTGTDDPLTVELENTIGDIVWTRSSPGIYVATSAGSFPDADLVAFLIGDVLAGIFTPTWIDADSFFIDVGNDNRLAKTTFEVRVYSAALT